MVWNGNYFKYSLEYQLIIEKDTINLCVRSVQCDYRMGVAGEG